MGTIYTKLAFELVKNSYKIKYAGSRAGLFWPVMLSILYFIFYTFIFGYLFDGRVNEASGSLFIYGLNIFYGLISYQFFSESIQGGADSIIGNANYIKKLKFPLVLLPLSAVAIAFYQLIISLGIYFLVMLIYKPIQIEFVATLIFSMINTVILTIAWSLIVAATVVYNKDLKIVLPTILSLVMFLSPIFYSGNKFGEFWWVIVCASPIALSIESVRHSYEFSDWGAITHLLIQSIFSLCFLYLAYQYFFKLQRKFSEVI